MKYLIKSMLVGWLKQPVSFFIRNVLLRSIYTKLKNKDVLICCSAPSAQSVGEIYDLVVSVSGGYFVAESIFRNTPDIAIFDESTFDEKFQISNESRRIVVSKLLTEPVKSDTILINSNGSRASAHLIANCLRDKPVRVSTFMRAFIINFVTGTNYIDNYLGHNYTQVGTGAASVAFCVFMKAKSIRLTGVNLRTGTASTEFTTYQYTKIPGITEVDDYSASPVRNHAAPDALVLASCALRYRDTCPISSDSKDLEPMLSKNLS